MKFYILLFFFVSISLIYKVQTQEDALTSYLTITEGDDLMILCTVQYDTNVNLVGKFSTKNAAGYFPYFGRELMFMPSQIFVTPFDLTAFAIKWFPVYSTVPPEYFKQPVGRENGVDTGVCRRNYDGKTLLCKNIGNVCYCPYFGQEIIFFNSFDILYSANHICSP